MSSTQTGFFDSLVAAVRENPVAAALIGGGVFWVLAGDEKLKRVARTMTAAASPMVDVGSRNLRSVASGIQRTAAPPTAPEMDHEGSSNVGQTLRDIGSAASDAVSGAAERIKDRFDEGIAYTRESVGQPGQAFMKAQSSLADMFERQPLVLGVVGMAVGAAIASAFRPSDLENKWVGELSDDVKGDLSTRAGEVSQSIREASEKLKSELKGTSTEAVDRVKEAVRDGA
jgi:hypothetical protein